VSSEERIQIEQAIAWHRRIGRRLTDQVKPRYIPGAKDAYTFRSPQDAELFKWYMGGFLLLCELGNVLEARLDASAHQAN
jgi:hypothetical protein